MSAFVAPTAFSVSKLNLGSTATSYHGVKFRTAPVRPSSIPRTAAPKSQVPHMVEDESSLESDTSVPEKTKLFVGNLSWGTTDESLGAAFSEFGTIVDSRVIMDRFTGKSRGFGFIEYEAPDSASQALLKMNGVEIDGRAVRVDRATRRNRQRSREEYY
ncbi:unnamed protein product [Agarophyton chilense]